MRWLALVVASWSSIAFADGPLKKETVVHAMTALRPQLDACYQRFHVAGMVVVDVTIAPTGSVTDAEIAARSDIAGSSPTGACVAQAVRAARLAPFDGPPRQLAYPFMLGD